MRSKLKISFWAAKVSMKENLRNCKIQHLPFFSSNGVNVDIFRLDLLHPIISGNKWFKLQYYLADAKATGKNTIVSFGGAFSNHLVATAYATKKAGLKSIGFVRGDSATDLSPTLLDAKNYGMQLEFVEREAYRNKEKIKEKNCRTDHYWIMEGGYGSLGAEGASEILNCTSIANYTHIICSVGTGTMMAGLIKSAIPHQKIVGISAMKNNLGLMDDVRLLLNETERKKMFSIIHDYHFGGYAKHPKLLIDFMKDTWLKEQLPTDIVYTSKLLFAVKNLISKQYFTIGTNLLLIHSGGLQGNVTLPAHCLPY